METKKWNFDILNHELSNEAEYMYKPVHVLFENCTCRSYNQVKRNPKIYAYFNSLKINLYFKLFYM